MAPKGPTRKGLVQMRWKSTATVLSTFVAMSAILLPATPADSAAWSPVGDWHFNEPGGASTAEESSGTGLTANVGDDVNTGLTSGNRTYYNFPSAGSWGPPTHDRLALVDDDPALDPGNDTYRVAIAIRTRSDGINILQKGQSGTVGGYWKIEIHLSAASCFFRGSHGEQSGVGSGMPVNDGQWHRIVCVRYPDHTVMRVDGEVTATHWSASGTVSNIKPLSIGGKAECGGSVGCDYFYGDIDYVRISHR